jgi:hypothetical protein
VSTDEVRILIDTPHPLTIARLGSIAREVLLGLEAHSRIETLTIEQTGPWSPS